MHYISTRGAAAQLDFAEATLAGLATDGGLYVPTEWPVFSPDRIRQLRGLSYVDLGCAVLAPLTAGCLDPSTLKTLLTAAWRDFDHAAIAPLKQLDSELYVMELFHGPTLAFKDFALQFLGQLFGHLPGRNACTIVGATSGDTGSAAITAMRGLASLNLFMLHPHGRVSPIQRRQMTTVVDQNIHNLAVDGTFDDCQSLVKALFNDPDFRRRHRLCAVNSINWARISAQVVYYFRAALELGAPDRSINFSVPTGNFGNVFAGYVARQMGLPINRLIIGSNTNDILTRFFTSGCMQRRRVCSTLSPSMDIQISSNFERFLFELLDRDSDRVVALMRQFSATGEFTVEPSVLARANAIFCAHRLDNDATRQAMRQVYRQSGDIMDPHSVIGLAAAVKYAQPGIPTVVLGTAHPAKFADAVTDALGQSPALPATLARLTDLPEKMTRVANNLEQIQTLMDAVAPDKL